MRSFQHIIALLFALLFSIAAAQDSVSYDATVYITSTVYRVNTVTLSSSPTGVVANQTSTFAAPAGTNVPAYPSGNGTAIAPTGTIAPSPSGPEFTGAASQMNVNALVAVLAAGVGYLAL